MTPPAQRLSPGDLVADMRHLVIFLVASFLLCLGGGMATAASKPADGERLLLIHATGGTQEKEATAKSGAYDSMVEYLTGRGYRVVDRQTAEQASQQIAATHEIDPVLNKAAAYGLKFLAEYTIHFKTSTIVKDPERGIGALVRVSAKVVDNTGARIISAKSAEASSTGHTTEDAIEKAARAAAKKAIELLASSLDADLAQTGNHGRTITLVLEGKPQALVRLLAAIESSPSVAASKEIESGGGKTTIEVICRIRRDQFERELLKAASQHGITLQKVRSEGNRSTWKIR